MPTLDVKKLANDILTNLNNEIKGDIETYVAFAKRQSTALAQQAAWITAETASKALSDADRDWFLGDLAQSTENFSHTIAALSILTFEKAWNSVVNTIWGAINDIIKPAIGITLPIPSMPEIK